MPTSTLRIAEPCHESWAAMTPAGPGRHCAACQKTVVDFTHKTDAEILATLRQAAGQTCGRLRPDQLSRPLVAPTIAPRWRAWLGAALAVGGALGAGRAAAQGRQANYYAGPQPAASPADSAAHPEPSPRAAPAELSTVANGPATLRGTVTDAASRERLPGVTVLLKGTNMGTSTDADGNFTLPVPASAAPVHLIFSSIGFIRQEQTVAPGSQPLAVALAADMHVLMGEVVITNVQRPWPWHPRRLFNWGKYWVTKPFRS
jgi:hypothetical protein